MGFWENIDTKLNWAALKSLQVAQLDDDDDDDDDELMLNVLRCHLTY